MSYFILVMMIVNMLDVIMLNAITLSVVAPNQESSQLNLPEKNSRSKRSSLFWSVTREKVLQDWHLGVDVENGPARRIGHLLEALVPSYGRGCRAPVFREGTTIKKHFWHRLKKKLVKI
jgi:hypothetical protein